MVLEKKKMPMRFGSTTDDYRKALSGEGKMGSLGYDWSDKPHRLVYDLCDEIDRLNNRTLHEPEHGAPKLLVRCARDWNFSDLDIATMLGFTTIEESVGYLGKFTRGDTIEQDDTGKRMRLLLRIFCDAYGLFVEDKGIISWLDQKATELGNKSPREKLLEGNLEIVDQYIRYLGNR